MKKLVVFWWLLALAFMPSFLMGQNDTNWVQMMSDPSANFYDVQRAFNNYWSNKPIEKGKGYKAFKRWEDYMAPRVYPSGNMTLPSQAYPNYQEWLNSQDPNVPTPKSLLGNWSALGPFGVSSGGGAGRINFVRFDPTNSNTIYVGTPDGGLWKSTNGGTSWTTNTDQLTVIGCTDIAIDPTNTQVMYLATGDGEAGDSYSVGILKSTDGGTTWNTTGLSWTVNQGRTISKLIMHPSNSQILIAATSNGIYRTTDGGANWTQTSTGDFKDVEFSPATPNTVYAAGTIFRKSTDNGATWTTITSGLPTTGVQRIAIAVTAANSAYVYLLIGRSSDQGLLGVYRSTDSGATFTQQHGATGPNLLGWNSNGGDAGGQAFYDLSLAASPTAANTIIVGGVNSWRSTDGGVNWTLNTHWTGSGAPYVHADIHAIEYLPGSGTTYFIGHDGGISKTTNSGTSFTDISGNMQIAQQYRIGLSTSTEGRLITGHQDNGTNLLSAGAWSQVYGGDGMDCFIDRTNNNTLYGSYVYGDYYKSTNGGASWTTITTGLPGGDWLCAWHQDPVTAATLYAGGRTALYKSTNGGTNWASVGTPSGSGSVLEFVIAPSNNQIIYAVKTDAISKSTNGGTSWTNITGTLPSGSVAFTNVTVSNTDPNIVWITCSGYSASNKVFKSINGGTSWTNISTGLPNVPCNTIVYQNGAANDVAYVGTDIGVFYRDNTMASWVAYMDNLPRVAVRDLEIYYPTGKIRAATFGRGSWESALATPGAFPPVADFSAPQSVCTGGSVTFTDLTTFTPTSWSWSFPGGTPATSTAQNPTVVYSTAGTYDVTLTATNANGSDVETKVGYITVVAGTSVALPLTEGFTAATFPPTDWTIVNTNASTTWVRDATIGNTPTTGNSMMFDNYSVNDSDDDEIRVKAVSLSGLSSAQLSFDVAYAPYDASNYDGLEVLVSTNCGGTFTSVFSKSNTTLATASATTSAFTPSAAQWRTETVDLATYLGQSNVIVAFRNLSGYGNRLFVDNINITGVSSGPVASFSASPSTVCSGQSVTVTDASTGATSWSWNFGAGATPATATGVGPHTVSYSSSGTKTITLTVNGSTTTTQNVTVNALPSTPTIIAGGPTTFCTGGSVTLTSSSASGNTWSTGATTQSITVSTGGTYTVNVTNGGCTSASSAGTVVTVNSLPSTPTITAGGPTTFCSGGSVTLTSSSASGNTWSNGATTQSITVSTGGTYTVNVTSGGCTSASSAGTVVTVNSLPSTPTITAGGPTTFCAGGSVTLTSSSASGNTWSTGATTQSITVSTGGTYTVNVTSGGCTSASSAGTVVTVNSLPSTPTITAGGPTTFCSGGSVTLTSSSASGNTWSNGATTQSITVSTGGTYTVNATSGGCTSASSGGTVVTVNSNPAITLGTLTDPSTCGTPTGSIQITGAGTGTLNWNGTATGSMTSTTLPATISGLTAGSYNVTFSDANGCASNMISQALNDPSAPATPIITAAGSTTFCSGGTVTLTSSAASGNTWSTGATTNSITVSTPGSYAVTVTDGGGCSASSATTVITVIDNPSLSAGTLTNPTACGTTTGSIVVNGSGTGDLSWTGTDAGMMTGVTLPATITGLPAGSYSISMTNANGCVSNTLAETLSDPAAPSAPIVTISNNTPCAGDIVTISSSESTGNTWSTGETTQTINVSASGTYSVTYSDANGCTSAASAVNITFNAVPSVTFDPIDNLCVYNPAITLNQGAPAGGTYSGTGVIGGMFDPADAGTGTATLTYSYTDGNGCSASATTDVFVDDCAGIGELAAGTIQLFPNPTTGVFTVQAGTLTVKEVLVYDNTGRLVQAIRSGNSTTQVDLTHKAAGMYTVSILTNAGIQRIPLIVNK